MVLYCLFVKIIGKLSEQIKNVLFLATVDINKEQAPIDYARHDHALGFGSLFHPVPAHGV